MIIREYKKEDKEKCIAVFQSNYPKYFDKSELELFIHWLDNQTNENSTYKSPTYNNALKDAYFVIELPAIGVIACGGFYITKDTNEARLAWGMIHANYHKQGYGTQLYKHREKIILKDWPEHVLTMGTSQHTFPFYQKMGMKISNIIKSGYGANLDRYDMSC